MYNQNILNNFHDANTRSEIFYTLEKYAVIHFTVNCSVTWPLNSSEAVGDLVLIKISLLLS